MSNPNYTPLVASLPASVPFVGPETQERERGRPFAARLGANESVFGPSPRAIAAMAEASREAWKYGDSASHELRRALADHHGIATEHIIVGEGIDGLLGNLVRLLVAEGDAVVTSQGAYPTFNYHVAGFGGLLHKVLFKGDHEDPEALIARARETGAKLVYISNPDNPMGSWHGADVIERMIAAVPEGCLLVLDEAYSDTAPEGVIPPLAPDTPRVIRMRTFSKAYGLAGMRVGYAIGSSALIAGFDRIRNHFGVGRLGQAAALAAVQDQEHLRDTVARIGAARETIARIARDNGLTPLPSATNFVTMDCGHDGDFARKVVAGLGARDIFVRMPFTVPQDRCIRVSCGTEADLAAFAGALPGALADARG